MTTTTDRPAPPPPAEPAVDVPRGGLQGPRPTDRGPIVAGVVLVTIGTLWALHVLGVSIAWSVLLPAAVVVVGSAVLLGGRSPVTAALVPLGVVLAVVAGSVTLLPGATSLETGERSLVVGQLTELEPVYELGAGRLTLDLRALDLPPGTTELRVDVGMGELRIRVPEEATVHVDGRVTAGELRAFGARVDGIGAERQVTDTGREGAGTLAVEARVGLGTLEVSR